MIASIMAILFSSCTFCRHKELKCTSIIVQDIENEVRESFNADSVVITVLHLKEETYFPTLIAPQICIFSPKQLPDGSPISKETVFIHEDDRLKTHTQLIVDEIIGSCCLKECNDIIVEYLYFDDNFDSFRSYKTLHYAECLMKNNIPQN